MRSFPWGGVSALCVALVLPLGAQSQPPAPASVTVMPDTYKGPNLDIHAPPQALLDQAPIGGLPPIPVIDTVVPPPDGPPAVERRIDEQSPQAGVFTFFRNRDQRPSGRTQLHPGEPSTAHNRDTYFGTGNTYGTLSKDSGMTWTHVNPFTLFPASDGGVCCDQRVIYDAGSDLTFWYIQYRYSSTTQNGGFRIAWTQGRDNLRNSAWTSAYFNAGSFGYVNNWLDFPDIAVSNAYLYITSNVFNASSIYQDSILGRISLVDFTDGGGISMAFYRRNGGMGGGASYRFTQTYNGAPSSAMYWASHNSTSSIRIFEWLDGNAARSADIDRTIDTWTSGAGSSVGPDGRDWIGFDDHRIASGYVSGTEGGFLWTSRDGGSFPHNYVQVARFTPATRAIIATDQVWSTDTDLAYPACGVNNQGHKGVVVSRGSATAHVATWAFLVDNYAPSWFGQSVFTVTSGTNGSPSNRWGDYHSVVANRIETSTFVGTAMHMSGGTATSNTVHEMAWFGRDDYTPVWVNLDVSSTGALSGVAITVDETDRNGAKNGSTPFTRSYTPSQGYTLTAPNTHVSGANTYLFQNWTGTGGGSASNVYTVSNIGALDDTATANYSLQTIVTVNDRNVAGAVAITVGTTDLDGLKNGSTQFTRRYATVDGPFSFTAPASVGAQPFRRWYISNIAQPIGQTTINVSPLVNAITIECEYCSHVHGSYATYGSGCLGSNGLTPFHNSTSHPDTGDLVTHTVSRLRGATPAVMFLGFSKTTWNGTPLPLCLGFIGANPSCCILTEVFLQLPIVIDGAGNGSISFNVTGDPAAIGVHTYTQVVAADIFLPDPLKIVVSNGLDMTIGGSSIGGARCP
jgi:hypothetical protein